jgi:F0F1-type ATP synthase membrane subunit c/vacuolar-type H+-ATPase subunit K
MENSNVEHLFRTTKIVWVVFFVSQISLLLALFLAKKELFGFDFRQSPLGEEPIVPIILAMMALFNFGLSFFLKTQAAARAVEAQNPKQVQTATILGLAFCESISIMGLVLAFVFNYQYFFLWFALGILGIILHFPRRDNFMAAGFRKP